MRQRDFFHETQPQAAAALPGIGPRQGINALEQTQLRDQIRGALPVGADFHLLRTRQAGRRKFADFHLLVDGSMNVRDAHGIAHSVESQLRKVLPHLEVTIHMEPIDEQESWEADELARLGEQTEPSQSGRLNPPPPIED